MLNFTPLDEDELYKAVGLYIDYNKEAFKKYGPINSWDTSKITDMTCLFSDPDFNEDISNWNVSNVESMEDMFAGNSNFNQDLRRLWQ